MMPRRYRAKPSRMRDPIVEGEREVRSEDGDGPLLARRSIHATLVRHENASR